MSLPVEVHRWVIYLQERKRNRQKLKADMRGGRRRV